MSYPVSYIDLQETQAVRGIPVDRAMSNRRVICYSPQIAAQAQIRKRRTHLFFKKPIPKSGVPGTVLTDSRLNVVTGAQNGAFWRICSDNACVLPLFELYPENDIARTTAINAEMHNSIVRACVMQPIGSKPL